MDRICIPSTCRIIYTDMGQIQRYLGPETHSVGRQCCVFRWVPHSGLEYQYPDVASGKSYTRHRWRRLDYLGQYLHQ